MAILTKDGRIAMAQSIKEQALIMVWAEGQEKLEEKANIPNEESLELSNGLENINGAREPKIKQFCTPLDPSNSTDTNNMEVIVVPEGIFIPSESPTNHLHLQFQFDFADAQDASIREYGVYLNSVTNKDLDKKYHATGKIEFNTIDNLSNYNQLHITYDKHESQNIYADKTYTLPNAIKEDTIVVKSIPTNTGESAIILQKETDYDIEYTVSDQNQYSLRVKYKSGGALVVNQEITIDFVEEHKITHDLSDSKITDNKAEIPLFFATDYAISLEDTSNPSLSKKNLEKKDYTLTFNENWKLFLYERREKTLLRSEDIRETFDFVITF